VEENKQLKRHNQRLSKRLQQAEIIIEFQKKLSEALGIPLEGESNE
jgi:regulator of replication initiation timing